MKRFLLATVAASALTASPSMAQGLPTWDNAAIIQRGLQHAETLRQWGATARSWRDQLTGMQRQYQQIRATYDSITQFRSMGSAGQILMDEALRRPGAPSARIAGIVHGIDRATGSAAYSARNAFALPQGDDPEAREMRRRSQSLANIQANAMNGIEAAETRIGGLLELLGIVETQPDLQASQTLGNRIASEQMAMQNEADRLKRTEIMIATQRQVDEMRDREAGRQSAQDWHDATSSAWSVPWR